MCGIAGFVGHFDPQLLQQMSAAIQHRGPDDADAIYLQTEQQTIGLAHQRLAIIDLSKEGRQPMTVCCDGCGVTAHLPAQKRLWLIYNGELYNYRELRTALIQKGHTFQTQTDSEVLLHLYAAEGPAFLTRLNGMFAFALYDGRTTPTVLLARDGLGIKPLYYANTAQGFLFASELKALLACHEVDRALDLTAIHYYLSYLWCPAPLSPLQSIKKLSPGEALMIQETKIVKRWYFYDLPYHQQKSRQTVAEMTEELIDRLQTAVTRQLMSDVPVGAFLSGGLDSSAIVAMMRKQQPQQSIRCYSVGFADGDYLDGSPADLPYAKQVAQHLNVDLTVLTLQPDMIQQLERMLYHLDEPQADPAPINALFIAEAAARDGIKVLLSGAGGDDIFSGYRRHYALQTEYLWSWLPQSIRRGIKKFSACLPTQSSLLRRFAKLGAHMDLPKDRRLASYFLWGTDVFRRNLYHPDMRATLSTTDTLQPLLHSLQRIPSSLSALDKMLYLEGKHFLADHNLNYTDKVSMAAGVEVRVPLLDPDLVAFAARIPSRFKQKGRIGKFIFKKAMEPYLPNPVIYRPKTGFGAPLRYWLHHQLRPMLHEVLSETRLKQRGLFDPKAVQQLIQQDFAGKIDGSYTIFSVLCIELWCDMFLHH